MHGPGWSRERRLLVAAGLNVAVVAGQAVAGVLGHSLGLLADAGHNLSDAAAVVLALVAFRLARRGPSDARTFGSVRWPVLAAQANAAALLVVSLLIGYEAIVRIVHPRPVEGGLVLAVALGAAAVNGLAALAVAGHHEEAGRDLNTSAALLHMTSDAVVSLGVAAAGAAILVGGPDWLDPAVSLGVGAVVVVQAFRLLARASTVLLEATPAGLDLDELRRQVVALPGVLSVHDVHAWGLSDQLAAASAHVELAGHPTLEEANVVGAAIKAVLAEQFGIAHATLELECEPCADPETAPCGLADMLQADVLVGPHHHADGPHHT